MNINMSCVIPIPQPKAKLAQHAARVTFLLYRPYINGAMNEPASAPHDIPIICAMNVKPGFASLTIAITAETATKNTTNTRSMKSSLF